MSTAWAKLSIKYKTLVFAAGLLLACWLYYVWLGQGQNEQIAALTQVEQAAKACGLQLVEIKPAPAVTKTGYRELPVEIGIKGTFAQTAAMLKTLEDIPRFNSLTQVSMNSRQGTIESKLVLTVYSYGVPAGTAVDKQAAAGQTGQK